MKTKILVPYIISILLIAATSCKKEEIAIPLASFHLSQLEYTAGDAIEVENLSTNATKFKWQCGTEIYETTTTERWMFTIQEPGTYTLRLTASNNGKESVKEGLINVLPKPVTRLIIKTFYEDGGVAPFSTINIYDDETDWFHGENIDYSAKTDVNGLFTLENIKESTYWIDAFKIEGNIGYLNWYTTTISNYKIAVVKNHDNVFPTTLFQYDY